MLEATAPEPNISATLSELLEIADRDCNPQVGVAALQEFEKVFSKFPSAVTVDYGRRVRCIVHAYNDRPAPVRTAACKLVAKMIKVGIEEEENVRCLQDAISKSRIETDGYLGVYCYNPSELRMAALEGLKEVLDGNPRLAPFIKPNSLEPYRKGWGLNKIKHTARELLALVRSAQAAEMQRLTKALPVNSISVGPGH